MTANPDARAYASVLRQAAHDAVRAVLAAPPESATASMALRGVTAWLVRTYGPGAAQDLAEELAVDLAEAFDALSSVEGRHPLALLDAWFHDEPAAGGEPAPDVFRSGLPDGPAPVPYALPADDEPSAAFFAPAREDSAGRA